MERVAHVGKDWAYFLVGLVLRCGVSKMIMGTICLRIRRRPTRRKD
jgi:hypothetical protein